MAKRKLTHSGPPEITAKPTFYNGVQFKSRLEARWAIFFDLMGFEWEYEPRKYFTGISNYIPDFAIQRIGHDQTTLLEIKGRAPSSLEIERLANAARTGYEYDAYICTGSILEHQLLMVSYLGGINGCSMWEQEWRQCPYCGVVGIGDSHDESQERNNSIDPHNDQRCVALDILSQRFDIPYYFWGFDLPGRPEIPKWSPVIRLALEIASGTNFSSPNLHESLGDHKRQIELLVSNGVFADSRFLSNLHYYALLCRKAERAPHYHPYAWSKDQGLKSFEVIDHDETHFALHQKIMTAWEAAKASQEDGK